MFDVVVAPSNTRKINDGAVFDEAFQSKGGLDNILLQPPTTTNENNAVDKQQRAVLTAEHPPSQTIQLTTQLAFLPTKFKKLIWIKRNDFVIVECGDEDTEEIHHQKAEIDSSSGGGGFRYAITHILYKDQVKHIKSKGLWPSDPFFTDDDHDVSSASSAVGESQTKSAQQNRYKTSNSLMASSGDDDDDDDASLEETNEGCTYEENGIVYDDPLGDDLMLNTNRISTLRVEESSSDDDSD